MKTRLALLTLAICGMFISGTAGAVKVTDVVMQKSSQFTEVKIVCDAPTEFTHQIVEAAANKPYRIVVDVKNAVPALPVTSFRNLPSSSIKQIRTSQFSVDPEKVVRIVFDVTGALTYKVIGNGNTFTLQINTPNDKDFTKWSATSSDKPTVTASTKPEAASKPATVAKTTTPKTEVAKTEAPKAMPASPDKITAQDKSAAVTTDKKDTKVAVKPIDESKLLTKVNKSATPANASTSGTPPTTTPQVAKETKATTKTNPTTKVAGTSTTTTSAKPATTVADATVTDKQVVKQDKTAKTEVKTTVPTTPGTETAAGKRADSVTLPQVKPTQGAPTGEPIDMAKPPKVQKTAFPETKVVKTPKYTESPEATNAMTGKIATATKGDTSTPTAEAGKSGTDSSAQGTTLSKSESVRQRYQANRDRVQPTDDSESDSALMAAEPEKPLSAIDKIRAKYKRGIRFQQNEGDNQQYATDTESTDESSAPANNVGPYNEFLPERAIVVYQTQERPDPFMPLVEEATTNAKYGELPDVETLRLVGILQDKKASRALFQDYNGYSYNLKTGDRVKNGFVLSIEETRVMFQIRQYGWNRQVAIDMETEN